MRSILRGGALLLCSLTLGPAAVAATSPWPEFRGPTRNGHADEATLPTQWSDTQGYLWKTPILGEGFSSPVIAGDTVWLTTALDDGRSMHAVSLDLNTGKLLHDVEVFTTANAGPKEKANSFASPSPVTDGERVYVWFGTHGVACLDAKTAEVVWQDRDFSLDFMSGAGSSPVLAGDLLILECDAADAQYVLALDKQTGKRVWKTDRTANYQPNAVPKHRSFSTATVEKIDGRDVLLSIGAQRVYGYDLASGKELFFADHPGFSNVARPIFADGLMIFSTGYGRPELWAFKVPEKLDPAAPPTDLKKAEAWRHRQGVPNKPSMVLVEGRIYLVADSGVARCIDARTGKEIWSERLGSKYSASPLYAGGLIYFFSETGEVHVLKPGGEKAEVVNQFKLEEGFMASPAVVENTLVLRSSGHVYRVK